MYTCRCNRLVLGRCASALKGFPCSSELIAAKEANRPLPHLVNRAWAAGVSVMECHIRRGEFEATVRYAATVVKDATGLVGQRDACHLHTLCPSRE
jgi:hypothetical protein